MKNPNPLMLVRIAQGDAYGMACEYIKFPRDQETYDQALRFERYGKHPVHKLEPGQYTDDTQMSIAVSEVLLSLPNGWSPAPHVTDGTDVLRKKFAASFFDCFKRDQRDGYSRGFQEVLEKVQSAEQLLSTLKPTSDKNGAAMRSVPLGVLSTPSQVEYVATVQAKITHDTIGGTGASLLVALMSHFAFHREEPLSDLPKWLRKQVLGMPSYHTEDWPGGPVTDPNVGINTARAVMTLVSKEQSLIDIARRTIEWGGDVDSVLAIAWGIASTRMKETLPPFFDGGLEDGEFGFKFLSQLGQKLMDKYA